MNRMFRPEQPTWWAALSQAGKTRSTGAFHVSSCSSHRPPSNPPDLSCSCALPGNDQRHSDLAATRAALHSRAMPFRFLHTADLHLDSPLRSLALRDPALADLIAEASRLTLRRIIDLALAEQVDAVLIAGDLYDGNQTSMKTARFLVAQLARLGPAGIRVFIIRGNHDAEATITRELSFPDHIHVFGSKADVALIETGAERIAIHGLSFRDKHAPESLLPRYKAPVPDARNIGMMHTSLNGAPGHDPYAPCALSDLQASGFDYWALGHIHKRAEYPGDAHVTMPGIPQGRDIGEAGAGSVTLVSLSESGLSTQAHIVSEAAFALVPVDLSGLTDWRDLRDTVTTALDAACLPVPHLVARLVLRGDTALAPRLWRDRDLALAEAQEAARALSGVWVEKLTLDLGQKTPASGALADLAQVIAADVRHSPAYGDALEGLRRDLEHALPPEARDAVAKITPEQIDAGIAELLARLSGEP